MRVLIAGGGTGGHLFPGIAVARGFIKKDPLTKILFVGTNQGIEKKIIPKEGFELKTVTTQGVLGMSMIKKIISLIKIPVSVMQSISITLKFKPQIVIGVGGYASFSSVIAAKILNIPSIIHEQNSIPGTANKFLSKIVNKIAVSFKETDKYFPKEKTVLTGNPVRDNIIDAANNEPLKSEIFTIFVFGGSQGASAINRAILDSLKYLGDFKETLEIIHQTGRNDYVGVLKGFKDSGFKASVFDFTDNISECYLKSDIVISRSGATTIAELTVCGKPAILIPFPYAAGNHQLINAMSMKEKDAAVILEEKNLTGEVLATEIKVLIKDKDRVRQMSKNSMRLGRIDACEKIIDICYELVNDGD